MSRCSSQIEAACGAPGARGTPGEVWDSDRWWAGLWTIVTGRGPRWATEAMQFVWVPLLCLLGLVALIMIGLIFPTVTPEEGSEVILGLATLLVIATLKRVADDLYEFGWHSSREAKRRVERARQREERDRAERREVLETWRFNNMTQIEQRGARAERARVRRWATDGDHGEERPGMRHRGQGREPKRFVIGAMLSNRPPPLRIAQPEP
jgi:hypothetical protein